VSSRMWEMFFKEEAPRYLGNSFTQNTQYEVDFILRELEVKRNENILDVGCGTGRHSIELVKRGYNVTGIDLSEDMLNIGRTIARDLELTINFVRGDASTTRLNDRFDHAISICEGAFSLFEVGVSPFSYHMDILKNIHAMLKENGRFLLTALNGLRFVREHNDEDVKSGHFDPYTISHVEELSLENGQRIQVKEKGFLPFELKDMLKMAGFEVLNIWGGTAGSWNKEQIKLDEIEIMVVSRKLC
jgi:cyclopropane fatty-acyl-phospholipid synthase-like methyltransferase